MGLASDDNSSLCGDPAVCRGLYSVLEDCERLVCAHTHPVQSHCTNKKGTYLALRRLQQRCSSPEGLAASSAFAFRLSNSLYSCCSLPGVWRCHPSSWLAFCWVLQSLLVQQRCQGQLALGSGLQAAAAVAPAAHQMFKVILSCLDRPTLGLAMSFWKLSMRAFCKRVGFHILPNLGLTG